MAELKRLLEHRRKLDGANTVEFDSDAFREAQAGGPTPPSERLHGREVQHVAAFRSGWTANPKFHEWQKPGTGDSTPVNAIDQLKANRRAQGLADVSPKQDVAGCGKQLEAQENKVADCKAEVAKKAPLAVVQAPKRSEELQRQQKQRLDKLLEFANAENERLNRLIKEAHGDFDQQGEQLNKLMASKAGTERILDETRRQREFLETSLKKAEAERDAARAETQTLVAERERLEGLVTATKDENARLESVVASVSAEKKELQAIVEQKAQIEQQLKEAQAVSAQLSEKAKRAERLERIKETGEAEQARLERLLAESTEEREAVLRQREALNAKVAEVSRHNEQLKQQLAIREKVEKAVHVLEEENVRLQERAQASEAETKRLEEVLVQTSDHNKQLQDDLRQAGERYSELEKRAATLEREREELRARPQVHEVEARIEAVKREAQEAHDLAAQEMTRHSQECKERVMAIEKEKETLQQELEQARFSAEASEERTSALTREKEEVQRQLEQAQASAKTSEERAVAMERERDALRHQLADLGAAPCPVEAAQEEPLSARGSEAGKEVARASRGSPHSTELMRQLVEAEEARAAEAADRIRLAQQLDEALRHNADLQERINKELDHKEAPSQPKVEREALKETDFSKILDNWLTALDDAHTAQAARACEKEAKKEPGLGGWMGSLFSGT